MLPVGPSSHHVRLSAPGPLPNLKVKVKVPTGVWIAEQAGEGRGSFKSPRQLRPARRLPLSERRGLGAERKSEAKRS